MPLTMSLYGTDPNSFGHLIIDRNNLIIAYPHYFISSLMPLALENRKRFGQLLKANENNIQEFLTHHGENSFAQTSDLRHNALEHVSEFDQYHCMHGHYTLKTDIDLNTFNLFLKSLTLEGFEDILSEECRQYLLETAEEYFSESKTSQALISEEKAYREAKAYEYEMVMQAQPNAISTRAKELDERFTTYFSKASFSSMVETALNIDQDKILNMLFQTMLKVPSSFSFLNELTPKQPIESFKDLETSKVLKPGN